MSAGIEAHLLRLATSVIDGQPVDWKREETIAGQIEWRIRHLRILATIAKVSGMPQESGWESWPRTPARGEEPL
jgi:hypothetical protein